ncbi:MAG TPA: putative metallopeptidase [Gemmatimonadales bacterium]|nr:putative metallopeptidase [Gemmatimonadales bacterium]
MTATATTNKPLKLPRDLADLDLKFAKALNAEVRQLWPEGEKFLKAEQPEEIAKILIRTKLHDRLMNAKLAYLFREDILSRGDSKLTVSAKAGGPLAFLTGFDFVVAFNHKLWLRLTPEQRLACVDHALSACERDPESGAYSVRLPDVAEYSGVVQRWGLWTPPLRGFGVAVESAQLEIFVPMQQFAKDDPPPRDLAEEAHQRLKRGGK